MSAILSTLAAKGLADILKREDWTNDLLAVAGGALDLYLLAKGKDVIFLIKNIGIPAADLLGFKMPAGLKYESLGQLGMLVAALFVG